MAKRLSWKQVSQYATSKGYSLYPSYEYYQVWSLRNGKENSRLFTGTLKECQIYLWGLPHAEEDQNEN